jgi:hypothetical protein
MPAEERDVEVAKSDRDPDADGAKSKFLEALERKRDQQNDGRGGSGPGSPKIHEAHGRAGAKRQFRRKSGG